MIKTQNIYLLRHGKPSGEPALNGHTDVKVPMNESNRIAQRWAVRFKDVHKIVTSPLSRCQSLAKLISLEIDSNMSLNRDLQEMYFGDIDGIPFDGLETEWEMLERFWQNPADNVLPNAEPLEQFHYRISNAWKSLIAEQYEDLIIVTHGGVIRSIIGELLELDWRNPKLYSVLSIPYGSVTHIKVIRSDEDYFSIQSIGVE